MRTIYASAGHSNKVGRDRGASGNGFVEGVVVAEFRNLLVAELNRRGIKPVTDNDDSILSQTLNYFRNLTTNNCIVLDIHLNAAGATATGTETLIPSTYTDFELELAEALSQDVHYSLGIPLRGVTAGRKGVKTEAQSHHGRLGWMRLTGQNVLMELCFISNSGDMEKYQQNKTKLVKRVADTLERFAKIPVSGARPQAQEKTYTVVSGDSLWKIAKKYNTTIGALQQKNGMRDGHIIPGQVLKV